MKHISWLSIILMLHLSLIAPATVSAVQSIETGDTENHQAARQDLDIYIKALEAIREEIPRDTFETSAIIEQVGTDPLKLTAWVRDNTRPVPYQGLLRGPIGVLMDRQGNSLDRAALLYQLLTDAGHTARLARGRLSTAEARSVYDAILSGASNNQPALPLEEQETVEQILARYATRFGLDLDELMSNHQRLDVEGQRLMEDASQRVAEQTEALLALVGPPEVTEPDKERQWKLEGLADHWWVQWQDKGNWVDLDVLKPLLDAKTAVYGTPAVMSLEEVPKRLVHTTNIRVVVETLESGKLTETIVLKQGVAPNKILEHSVVSLALSHVPSNISNTAELQEQEDPMTSLKSKLLETEEWLPVLTIDRGTKAKKQFVVQNRFTINGEFTKTNDFLEALKDFSQLGKGMSKSFEGFGGAFGGLPSGIGGIQEKEPVKEEPRKVVTAEWIEYEINVPGQETKRIRRQIFDLLGPHARSAGDTAVFKLTDNRRLELGLALLGETTVLSLANSVSIYYVAMLTVDALLVNLKQIQILTDPKRNPGGAPQFAAMPGATYTLAATRDGWRRMQNEVYFDRPNVITMHRGLRMTPSDIVKFEAFDIVYNQLAVNDTSQYSRYLLNLEQGVLDTNAEAFVLGDICRASLPEKSCVNMDNTSELLASSLSSSEQWTVLNNREDLQQLQVGKDVRARIGGALDKGYKIVVSDGGEESSDGSEPSWWIVDPGTGRTLGIVSRGWGGSYVEFIFVVSAILSNVWCFTGSGSSKNKYWRLAACSFILGISGFAVFMRFATAFLKPLPDELKIMATLSIIELIAGHYAGQL